jgi:hypothetical protein
MEEIGHELQARASAGEIRHELQARASGGLAWKMDPYNEFRIMEAVEATHISNKKVPYASLKKNGKLLGINNKYVYKANKKYYEDGVEITLSQFEEFSHVPISQLSDEILNKFFGL